MLKKAEEKINELAKVFTALGKLMIKVAEFLTFAILVELTIKSMIQIWTTL